MNEITQQQVQAIISLLIAARYQDSRLTLLEEGEFTRQIEKLPWKSTTGLSVYLQQRTAVVRDAIAEEHKKRNFIAEQCALLSTPEAKSEALRAITAVFLSDGIDPKERTVLAEVQILLN